MSVRGIRAPGRRPGRFQPSGGVGDAGGVHLRPGAGLGHG